MTAMVEQERTPETFPDLISEHSVWIDAPTGTILNGALAAAAHDHTNWNVAFRDSSASVESLFANSIWSCVQHNGYGTHLGDLELGGTVFPATGNTVSINVLDMVKLNGETKATLIRNYYDTGTMMDQLGVLEEFLMGGVPIVSVS